MQTIEHYLNAASASLQNGQLNAALKYAGEATKLAPKHPHANYFLGVALFQSGDAKSAIKAFRKAVKTDPNNAGFQNALGSVYQAQGKLNDARQCFIQATRKKPDFAGAFNNLGVVLKQLGQLSAAETAYRKAVSIQADYGDALNNLGLLLQDMRKLDEAIVCFERAVASGQCQSKAHSNLLLTTNYSATIDPETVASLHKRYGDALISLHGPENQTLRQARGRKNLKRIGYISPDFRTHSVAYFFEPLIAAHDHTRYEIFCYYNHPRQDETTIRIKQHADHWRDVAGLDTEALIDQITGDKIDVLVDLSGHTGRNRLDVFARRAAPMQVTWLGYPNTSGLETMDFRIVDAVADPPEISDTVNTEQLIRLPEGFLCYGGDPSVPVASDPPCARNHYVTFGSFNNLTKVTPKVIDTWAGILKAVPDSRLILKSTRINSHEARDLLHSHFSELGIDRQRIQLYANIPSVKEHLALYNEVDIALDPFPYNGTTTTFEALWMGVPVLTLAGQTHAARVGTSILHHIGHAELIADSVVAYQTLASELASNRDRIGQYRAGLRADLQNSAMANAKTFAVHFEQALESAWRAEEQTPTGGKPQ